MNNRLITAAALLVFLFSIPVGFSIYGHPLSQIYEIDTNLNMSKNPEGKAYNITNVGWLGVATGNPLYAVDIVGTLRTTSDAYLATSGGRVGIGTTTPAYDLDVAGVIRGSTIYQGSNPVLDVATTFGGDVSGTYNNLQLGVGVVGSAEVADNSLTANDIAANAITASELADNAVDTAAIQNGAVTGAKIASATIDASKLVSDLGLGWKNLTDYPAGCGPGKAVQVIGDTLTCIDVATPSTLNITGAGTANALAYWLDNSTLDDLAFGTSGQFLKSQGANNLPVWDTINLGTDTEGNYVAGINAGGGITVTGSGGEGSTPTIAHADTSNQASVTNTGNTFIQNITLDTYGHVTGLASATVVESDPQVAAVTSGRVCYGTGSAVTCNDNFYWDAANDRVGIGTTSPAYKLDVEGDIYANGGWVRVSGTAGLYFQSYGGGWYMSDSTWIRAYNNKAIYSGGEIQSGNNMRAPIFYDLDNAAYYLDPASTGNSLLVAGNVGIGTTTPQQKLDVVGNMNTTGNLYVSGNVGVGTSSPQAKLDIEGGNLDLSYNNIENVGEINGISSYAIPHSYATNDAVSPKVWLSDQGDVIIMSYENNNPIFVDGSYQTTLNAGQSTTLSLSAGSVITASEPFSTASTGSAVAVAVPISWAGYKFAYYVDRGDPQYIWMFSPFSTANVKIYNGTSLVTTLTISKGSYTSYSNNFVGNTLLIESDSPIIIWKRATTEDGIPLYPCSKELYGVASGGGYVCAVEDGTSVTMYTSSGSTSTASLNRGQCTGLPGGGSQYAGPATRIVANKPVCARAEADGDGGEQTPFTGLPQHATNFVLPNDAEFVALVSYKPTTVRVYNSTDVVCESTLSGTNGVYFVKVDSTSCGLKAGYRIITDNPVWAIYEDLTQQDETILQGYNPSSQVGLVSMKGTWGSTGDFYAAGNGYVAGNVGIGTTSPNGKLHVIATSSTNALVVSNDTTARGMMYWDATNNRLVIQVA